MRVIDQVPDCRIQDIAEQLAITNSGAGQAVDKLELSGHAQRRPNPADRRSSVVVLTAPGGELLDAAAETLDQHLRRVITLPEPANQQPAKSLEVLLTPPLELRD